MELTKAEEQIMQLIWDHEPMYFKDIMEQMPAPIPATTTVATLLKRMTDKGFISYELHGNSRQYHSLVSKDAYFKDHVGNLVNNFFGKSALEFASFFTQQVKMSKQELEELRKMIDQKLKDKK